MMAAGMHEPAMSDIDLDEDARRLRAQELERFHHLPVHRLSMEKELREVNLPSTPSTQRHAVNGSSSDRRHSGDREYPVDVRHPQGIHAQGQPATVTVTEKHVIHQETPEQTKSKKQKRVQIFSGFGRTNKGHVGEAGEGREGDLHGGGELGGVHEKNGASKSRGAFNFGGLGQGHPEDYDKPTTLTVYPNYLKRLPGILRIAQLLVGVIVCAAVNAERCISNSVFGIVCGSASSPMWFGVLGGQGFVLFVGIIFILGNFVLIFHHICMRPKIVAASTSRTQFDDKFRLIELAYNGIAVVLYIIAASVEAWYASWTTLTVKSEILAGVVQHDVRNVYRPQWIAAAVFAWLNVVLYAIDIVVTFLFR